MALHDGSKPKWVQYELVPWKHPCHVQGCTERPAPYVPIVEVRNPITGFPLTEYQMPQYLCDRCRRLLIEHSDVVLSPEVVRWVQRAFKENYGVEPSPQEIGIRFETTAGLRPVNAPLILPAIGRKLE